MKKTILTWFAVLCVFLSVAGCSGGAGGGSSASGGGGGGNGGSGGGGGGTYAVPQIADVNGGISGSGFAGSTFIVDGSGFGSLTAANATCSLDFRDARTNAVVATASINYSAGDWNDTYIKGTVPDGLTALTAYKVTVTTPGGTSNAVNFLVVAHAAFTPAAMLWSQTQSLPAAQEGFPTVVAPIFASMTSVTTNYIYTLGGKKVGGKTAYTNIVYCSRLNNATGAINAPWARTTPLPGKRGFSAAVLANRFNSPVSTYGTVYVLGGLNDQGNVTDTVYYASLNVDGTIAPAGTTGTWATTTKLPKALFAAGAVIFHGRIYVAGGNDATGSPVTSAYAAQINSDGTLGAWQALPDMPITLAYHRLVTAAGYLYAIGGDSASADPLTNLPDASSQGDVYYNKINFPDGTLVNDAWSKNPIGMGTSREKHSAVVAGGYLLVSGGLYSGATNGSHEQSYAAINPDGSLASFIDAAGAQTISGSPTGYNFYNHSAAYFVDDSGNPHVLILGGADAVYGTLHSEVWYQH